VPKLHKQYPIDQQKPYPPQQAMTPQAHTAMLSRNPSWSSSNQYMNSYVPIQTDYNQGYDLNRYQMPYLNSAQLASQHCLSMSFDARDAGLRPTRSNASVMMSICSV
jgi:hypothetical protein